MLIKTQPMSGNTFRRCAVAFLDALAAQSDSGVRGSVVATLTGDDDDDVAEEEDLEEEEDAGAGFFSQAEAGDGVAAMVRMLDASAALSTDQTAEGAQQQLRVLGSARAMNLLWICLLGEPLRVWW